MVSTNKVILVGRLSADPEVRYMPSGDAIANLRVATSEAWNDKKTQQRKEVTEYHRVNFYDRNAQLCADFLRKGSQIYLEGSLRTRKWKDAQQRDRFTTEINGDYLMMLGSPESPSRNEGIMPPSPPEDAVMVPAGEPDDIPIF